MSEEKMSLEDTEREGLISKVEALIAKNVRKAAESKGSELLSEDTCEEILSLLLFSEAFSDDEWITWLITAVTEREVERVKTETLAGVVPELTNELKKRTELLDKTIKTAETALNKVDSLRFDVSTLKNELTMAPKQLARSGGEGKAIKYEPLKSRVIEIYQGRGWGSARQAAFAMEEEIIELAKSKNIDWNPSQPWESIYKWISRYEKDTNRSK